MKKNIILSLSFLLLTGCSTVDTAFFKSKRGTPVVQKKEFVGRSAGEVLDELGKPRTILTETPHQVWTYRDKECITLVYFDENNEVCFAEERGNCGTPFIYNALKENENGTESDA